MLFLERQHCHSSFGEAIGAASSDEFVPIASALIMVLAQDASNSIVSQFFGTGVFPTGFSIVTVKDNGSDDEKKAVREIDHALVGLSCMLAAGDDGPGMISWLSVALRFIIMYNRHPITLAKHLVRPLSFFRHHQLIDVGGA